MDAISEKFAQFVTRLRFDDFTGYQVQKIKTYFMDWLGSAYAGQTQPPIKIMLQVVDSLGGRPESTLIPDNTRTMSLLAALVNGASSHMVEMDDLHRESIFHPAAPIMPAVFAAAEREKASGKDLIVAIAAGYEVGIRVAVAVGQSHYQHWHTTSTCGTFGAAAGAAKILGLDEKQVVWALGSAGTQASGLWEFLVESAMSKQLHPGKAALNGLLSALLAQKGFTGARKILEGEKGFFRATCEDFDQEKSLAGLGKNFLFERNSLKYYASCGHTHSAIESILQATEANPMDAGEIERVDVSVYQAALDLLEKVEPSTPYVAKFSLPFCVATALKYGHVSTGDFIETRLQDPELLQLMEQIEIHSDPQLSLQYPAKWPARVEIITRDGKSLRGSSDYPKGDPENPLEERDVIEKFRDLTRGLLSESRAEAIVERVMGLEDMDDVSHLLDGL
ncbi:MAG: MmgE/PrpD family protein [Desulfobacteraceae bacterium]|jgi:2-methylcitrate dehydratase PrpD